MEENKQIEEMAKIAAKRDDTCRAASIAYAIYNAGYRKQVEGEWILEHETYGKMICSVCGKECPIERKPDPYEDYQITEFYVTSPFCRECGARMKGDSDARAD